VAWRAARPPARRVVSGYPSLHAFTRAEEPAVWWMTLPSRPG